MPFQWPRKLGAWASRQGTKIERFNLAHQPQIFADQPVVRSFLQRSGQSGLPLTLLNGEIVLAGRYPTREELTK
ncbi:arsenic metallochaperone ArsD family protein [Pseudomonas nitroreducens]|uniref:arsenic metallochaperone ArsD family protein n=1 Tax=Pseudomonas nitroreducens TaxID=46680 RepID=UPI0028ACDABC|nr:arsenic metallochaperone ArsD family protein [Pseudomonas nitroreducens]